MASYIVELKKFPKFIVLMKVENNTNLSFFDYTDKVIKKMKTIDPGNYAVVSGGEYPEVVEKTSDYIWDWENLPRSSETERGLELTSIKKDVMAYWLKLMLIDALPPRRETVLVGFQTSFGKLVEVTTINKNFVS